MRVNLIYFLSKNTFSLRRVMRIGVSEFFQPEFESEREDECSWAMHGVIEGKCCSRFN